MMHLAQLELFVAVVETGGMTPAGELVGMSQPAVSRSMRNLEREIGVALFARDGRNIAPTPAGSCAYTTVVSMLGSWNELQVELRRLGGRPSEVTVSVPFGTARVVIPVLVRRAAQTMPDIRVNVVERASPYALRAVADHEYAMALVYPEAAGTPPPVQGSIGTESPVTAARPVATERLCAVGRPDLLGDAPDAISLSEVARLPLMLSEPSWGIRRTIDAAFERRGITPRVVREVGIAEALMAFAIEGEGVTILPRSNVVREHELGTLVVREIAEPEIRRSLALTASTDLPTPVDDELTVLFTESMREVKDSAGWVFNDQP